jgi:hypothetical protein
LVVSANINTRKNNKEESKMVESYIYNEPSSSLNTMSQPQVSQPTPIDLVEKMKENFAQNATKVDFYKDNTGLNWVAGYVGKAKDGAEWRLWTSYKPAADGSDAKYIATNLNEAQAMDMFKSIVGKSHDEIVKSISPEIPTEEEESALKETEEFVDEPQDVTTSDLKKKDVFETTEPKLKDLVETQTWEKQVSKSKNIPDYLILKAVKGDSQPLINWAGRVGMEKATADLTGKPGIASGERLAAWLIEKAIGKPYAQQMGRKAGKGAGHIVTKEDLPDVSSLDDSALSEIHSNLESYMATIEKESMKRFKTGTAKPAATGEGEAPATGEAPVKGAKKAPLKIKSPADKLKEAQGEAAEPKTTAGAKGKVSKWADWQDWAWKDQTGQVLSIDPSKWNMSPAEVENEKAQRSVGKGPAGRTLNNGWETAQWNAIRLTNQYGHDDPRAKKARQQFHIMAGPNYDKYMNRYGFIARGAAKSMSKAIDTGNAEELNRMYGIPQKPTESFEEADARLIGGAPQQSGIEANTEAGGAKPEAKPAFGAKKPAFGKPEAEAGEAPEAGAEAEAPEAEATEAPAEAEAPEEGAEAQPEAQPEANEAPEAKPEVGGKPAKLCPKCGKKKLQKSDCKCGAVLASLKKKQYNETTKPELATLRGNEIKTSPQLANLKVEKGCPTSKKQARLFGAVAGGAKTEAKGLSKKEAESKLRGKKLKNLPEKAPKKK